MIQKNISISFLNKKFLTAVFLLFTVFSYSQENTDNKNTESSKPTVASDTIPYKYGLRLGIDLKGPISTLLNSDNELIKATADARIYKNYFVAAEMGYEKNIYESVNLNYTTSGYFLTVGADYDFLGYTPGRNDVMAFGIRYGISRFEQTVDEYQIQNAYWNNDTYTGSLDSQVGYAHWANFRLGLKVEVLKNLYLGTSVGVNFLFTDSKLDNFSNLYIPGFGKNRNNVSWVFNYTVMYLIPFN
ncbi:MAG: DUF6048 family protein [Bacteroidota bacterium]